MKRAVTSEYLTGVKIGARTAQQAGGRKHMTIAELERALFESSTRLRTLGVKLAACEAKLAESRINGDLVSIIRRNDIGVCSS